MGDKPIRQEPKKKKKKRFKKRQWLQTKTKLEIWDIGKFGETKEMDGFYRPRGLAVKGWRFGVGGFGSFLVFWFLVLLYLSTSLI